MFGVDTVFKDFKKCIFSSCVWTRAHMHVIVQYAYRSQGMSHRDMPLIPAEAGIKEAEAGGAL